MTTSLAISTGTLAAIVVVLALDLFAVLFALSFRRARRAGRLRAEAAAAPTAPGLQAEEARLPKPVSRREFFRRSLVVSFGVFLAEFGAASIAFLWPNLKGGFGSVITAGKLDDIKNQIGQTNQPFYYGAGRFYIVPYAGSGKDPATAVDYVAEGVTTQGLMPLYQRCVHLGCRVPFCPQSQWFECPCHGSKYNRAGEYQLGPAPHGMDRFKITVDKSGNVIVDTSEIILGPPRTTNTINEPPQGQFCVAPG